MRLLREAAASGHTRSSLADELAEIFAQAIKEGLGGEDWAVRAAFELGASTFAGLPPANLNMPPLVDPKNVYSETGEGKLSPATAGALSRVTCPTSGPAKST